MILENQVVRVIIAFREEPPSETANLLQVIQSSEEYSTQLVQLIMEQLDVLMKKVKTPAPTFVSTSNLRIEIADFSKNACLDDFEDLDEKMCSWREHEKSQKRQKYQKNSVASSHQPKAAKPADENYKDLARSLQISINRQPKECRIFLKNAFRKICRKGMISLKKLAYFVSTDNCEQSKQSKLHLLRLIDNLVNNDSVVCFGTKEQCEVPYRKYLSKIKQIVQNTLFRKHI